MMDVYGATAGSVIGLKKRRGQQLPEGGARPQAMCVAIEDVYGGVIAARQAQDDPALIELAASIRRHGLLQPILVRRNPQAGRYALICGARRLAACRLAGLTHVDAIVLSVDDAEATCCFMEEHLTRREPGFLDEAQAVQRAGAQRVLERFALPAQRLTERLDMLALPETVRALAGRLTLGQARPLLRVREEGRQREAAQIIAQRELTGGQARRLVMGPPAPRTDERAGRRRAVQEAMEDVSRLSERLCAQGVNASVRMHSQEGGVCIQILLKNGENLSPACRKRQEKHE